MQTYTHTACLPPVYLLIRDTNHAMQQSYSPQFLQSFVTMSCHVVFTFSIAAQTPRHHVTASECTTKITVSHVPQ